jgi:uncharacterized protein YkwD
MELNTQEGSVKRKTFFSSKKIFLGIVALIVLFFGVKYFEEYEAKFYTVAGQGLSKASEIAKTAQKEIAIATPGALRSKADSKQAFLTRSGTINFTNIERKNNNLRVLKENPLLNKAALAKANDMFLGQYFEHISPNGTGPAGLADRAGYLYIAIGENLAMGNFKNDEDLVRAWMNSPGHRANILNPKYTEIGVAVLEGEFEGRKVWLAVQEFGKPQSDCPGVDEALKIQMESVKSDAESMEPALGALKAYLEKTEPVSKEEIDFYNQKVTEFNNLVKSYNNKLDMLKFLTSSYNAQVRTYNTCIAS